DFGIAKVLGSEERNLEHVQEMRGEAGEAARLLKKDEEEEEEDEAITGLTRHGAIMGTLAFMSPEQWGIGVPLDHRTDIWAVGIMLFRMLAGKHPLDPLRGEQLYITAQLDEPMPKLRDKAPDVPPELAEVIDGCLIKDKEKRTADALALLRGLERFLPGRFTRELKIDESPYAGLSSFQESDADRFFGRAHEIAAMVNRIRDQPLIGVVGPSGTGKSSVVRAGLVPALKRSGENWETLVVRPGRNPMSALANIVSPLLGTSSNLQDDLSAQQKLAEKIRQEPGYVGSVLRARARREKHNILLFVDQFEELYTNVAEEAERKAFTACLSGIADDATSPIRVVLSIRSDFLDRVPEDQRFMSELTQGLFFLTSPNRDGLKDALVQPAEMAGYHFETPAIVDDMLEHLHATQGALPLLQFAASKLWDSRDPARKLLTEASYKSIGGIAGALASHADAVLNELSGPSRNLVRAIFLRLVTPERTRAIASITELRELSQDAPEIQRIIDQLVQARLLVVQSGGGADGASVEIVHESLIHSWPTLKRWLDETGEDSAFLEQLRNAARQWQAKGHDSG
ncbi:MAG: serine/threonine protein kinase, partial [Myxococcales bacterium]